MFGKRKSEAACHAEDMEPSAVMGAILLLWKIQTFQLKKNIHSATFNMHIHNNTSRIL